MIQNGNPLSSTRCMELSFIVHIHITFVDLFKYLNTCSYADDTIQYMWQKYRE